nr:MAG TPA: hypothetical protein [Caudoviricetes sp.]
MPVVLQEDTKAIYGMFQAVQKTRQPHTHTVSTDGNDVELVVQVR